MSFSLRIKASAVKELRRVPAAERSRIVEAIDGLAADPWVGRPLKGKLTGLRRIRVGSYRVVYEIAGHELVVLVLRVAERSRAHR